MLRSERGKRKGMVHNIVKKGIAKANEYELCSALELLFLLLFWIHWSFIGTDFNLQPVH